MREDSVERSRHAVEIERIDEEAGVPDLAAPAAAHEPPKLLLDRTAAPFRHLLERSKPMEIVVGAENLFDARGADRTDQLLLEIRLAHVEPELLHIRTGEVRAEARALERPAKHRFLAGIAETREPQAVPAGAELLEEGADAVCASEANDLNVRGGEVDPAPLGQRLDCDLIAYSFNDYGRAQVGPVRYHVRWARAASAAVRAPGVGSRL
jgi:hypothetical protein